MLKEFDHLITVLYNFGRMVLSTLLQCMRMCLWAIVAKKIQTWVVRK